MKKLITLFILLTYIALVPLCFADTGSVTHGMDTDANSALAADYPIHPITHHADMYQVATSAVAWSVLFVVLVFLCAAVRTDTHKLLLFLIHIFRNLKLGDWLRIKYIVCHSMLHWLVLHIASPNTPTRCA